MHLISYKFCNFKTGILAITFTKVKTISDKNILGAGFYTANDISRILGFPKSKVARYLNTYWDKGLGESMFNDSYSWKTNKIKAVNFYVLIELYTFLSLQEYGISNQKIFRARKAIAKDLNTPYPFAFSGILTNGKKIWYAVNDNIIDANGTRQANIVRLIQEFAKRIDFDSKSHIAQRFYPAGKTKSIVVDPHHQFGSPVIKGTNINAEVIYSMIQSGEKIEKIKNLYDLSTKQIKEAVEFYNKAA